MTLVLKFSAVVLGLLLLEVKSCPQPETASLGTEDYIAWVENPENGLVMNKEMNDLIFSVQYKPLAYEVLLQEKRTFSDGEMKLEMDSISDMQYYTFRIATAGGTDVQRYRAESEQDYYARLEYFALQMQNDLVLIDGSDTLPCLLYHYERTYGIDPRATFVMGFSDKKKSQENKTLMYTDRVFGSGPVLLTIESEDLKMIPQLYLSE